MTQTIKNFLISLITPAIIIAIGYFAVLYVLSNIQNSFESKIETERNRLINEIEHFERGFNNKINVLQRSIDENSNAIEASARTIPSPNLIQRMFNSELNRVRNEIMDSIPEAISQEIKDLNLDVASTAAISLQIEGDIIRFPVDQQFVEGYWGTLRLIESDEFEPYFELELSPIQIDINEIRTTVDPILNQQRVFVSAIDKRSGREITITSTDFTFLEERRRGLKFDPKFSMGLGTVFFEDALNPLLTLDLNLFRFAGEKRTYEFLSFRTNIFSNSNTVKTFTTVGLINVTF